MRRVLCVVIVVVLFAPSGALAVNADRCKFNSMHPGIAWTQREENRTAWCVVEKWPVPGGHPKFNAVAECESGWNRFAYNPNGHAGLFQHDIDYWPGRVRAANDALPWWDLKPLWRNPRTQMVVTARMVHHNGWRGWTCA